MTTAMGKVVAGWLPAGAHLAMAFGTMSAGLFESASHRSIAEARSLSSDFVG